MSTVRSERTLPSMGSRSWERIDASWMCTGLAGHGSRDSRIRSQPGFDESKRKYVLSFGPLQPSG